MHEINLQMNANKSTHKQNMSMLEMQLHSHYQKFHYVSHYVTLEVLIVANRKLLAFIFVYIHKICATITLQSNI